jgi:hypothetical protein
MGDAMAFMQPIADYFAAYRVETDAGTELVPESACGRLSLADDGRYSDTVDALTPYLENNRISNVERVEGYFSRLSAPGYLDCTDWLGPYETEQAALDAVKDMYDCDDNGDDADDDSSESAEELT